MKAILILSALVSFSVFASEEKAIEISCNFLKGKSKYITADVYKNMETNEAIRAEIQLKESKVNGKTLKTWDAKADYSNMLLLKLVGKNVELVAFGDDVGALSSITIDGVEKQLQCDVQYLLE